ncbi:MAG: hypothetical protein N3F66_00820 [Spirochaetes bacterium]|nr:hypothetical protein [Spirochaetota bacterium]
MRLIQSNIVKISFVFVVSIFISCLSFFEEKQETKDLLPSETELYTWKLIKITSINNKNEILSVSPHYYQYYAVTEIVKGEYQSINNPAVYITVTIAKTTTIDDAYGLFTRERVNNEKSNLKNNYSIYWKNRSIAFKGNMLIKLETNDTDYIKTQKNMIELILEKIQLKQALPDSINTIAKYCALDNVIIFNEGIPPIPYIKKIIVCKKLIESKEITAYYKIYTTNLEASQNFDMMVTIDNTLMLVESGKIKLAFKKFGDSYCYIAQYNEWIFGVYDITDYNIGKQYTYTLYKELSTP